MRRDARAIFDHVLGEMDARKAVLRSIRIMGTRLEIVDSLFDLSAPRTIIYSIALGKAAAPMAKALDEILGERLAGGVISTQNYNVPLSSVWRKFAGGHPAPNQASFEAARASFELLKQADEERALVIFLISGGGSAMLEWPQDERVALDDLIEANRALVSCGASIAEINSVRRSLSAVKGGGLSCRAPRATQVTLIISDTNRGDEENVASGPTIEPSNEKAIHARDVIARYDIASRLPTSVIRAVEEVASSAQSDNFSVQNPFYVLLDNTNALTSAAEAALTRGYRVEIVEDINEQPIDEGCRILLARLLNFRRACREPVCLISGGELACPVRGKGIGGRNSETILRLAMEMDRLRQTTGEQHAPLVALSAGTDGIDGNSPAAGAIADTLTLARARFLKLDSQRFLNRSDSYTFFNAIGDSIMTGATGTNVRDVRILLAG
jgi:glycerate 2-kinase